MRGCGPFRDDAFRATRNGPGSRTLPNSLCCLPPPPPTRTGRRCVFLVEGAAPEGLNGYERAVFLFDGHDTMQLEAAREHWKAMKAAGHDVTYWQQGPDRRWQKKA